MIFAPKVLWDFYLFNIGSKVKYTFCKIEFSGKQLLRQRTVRYVINGHKVCLNIQKLKKKKQMVFLIVQRNVKLRIVRLICVRI